MRELSLRIDSGELLDFGYPLPGELSWGYRNQWIDRAALISVVDGLNAAGVPLSEPEDGMSVLLRDDHDRIDDLAERLVPLEGEASAKIWCFYVARHLDDSVKDLSVMFELLDVAWADLGYPDELRSVLFPREFKPAHLYIDLGREALDLFLNEWKRTLSSRDPEERLR
ncbi:hypothetical protein [Paractinoplanes atraurantiacus]|uniref:DUF2247 family protein n=1 Tax=Paractinoplanes atraurantiacus TaxID=1036182 RepID=A0A285IHU7_9ACTN|nr:hypothetical protein [Actinoplanes atraurantiacus]SNY47580.1 hypothetical protein SAMN05421748_108167 [Actinoplanes atraurantiacus]